MDDVLIQAHKHSARHRQDIETSGRCGCFYCCAVFEPSEIEEWVDADTTALCPRCGIDAVLGDASGLPVTAKDFLTRMKSRWF
ncbi:cytoplasmic protein [Rhizobium sophoriradicis]|uniref:Cytoplasmic protein n=1 Tax=Rhizobium sophoriradicis TaxID=1535245 RepID=A0A2A5L1G3_9HYPH|nr:cytoplasmic protein [Rhizobium sophoriradicis]